MGIHRPIRVVLCFILVFKLTLSSDDVTIVKSGTSVELPCRTGSARCRWEKTTSSGETTVIVGNSVKVSNHSEDDNVQIRLLDSGCPLEISEVTSQNEGIYVCTADGNSTTIQLKVDEPQPLYIFVDNELITAWHVFVNLGDYINVTCLTNVSNSNSVTCLDFPLSHTSHEKHEQCDNQVGTNIVNVNYHVTHKDGAVVCTLWEDELMLTVHKVAMHVTYEPECYLQIVKNIVTCTCDAYPELLYYVININGEPAANATSLKLESSFRGNISCTGVNSYVEKTSAVVFYEAPEFEDPYATAFWVITCIIVIVVVIVILSQAVVTCRAEYHRKDLKNDEEVERNTEINRKMYSAQDGSENQLLSLTENTEDRC